MKKFVVAVPTGVEVVESVKEAVSVLAKQAGISVTQKAVLKGDVEQCQWVDESEIPAILEAAGVAVQEAVTEVLADDAPASTDVKEDAKPEDKQDDVKQDAEPEVPADKQDNTPADMEYPEVGFFKDDKAFKKHVKKVPDANVIEWCELEGVEWKHNDHASINRMRAIMALKAKHFPHLAPKTGGSSKKSKYAEYSTEALVQMALDNEVDVDEKSGDARILRMKTIMALRDAGVIA